MDVLLIQLHGEARAIPAGMVQGIISLGNLTPVPTAPPEVLGIVEWQGQVVPVVDLGREDNADSRVRIGAPLVVIDWPVGRTRGVVALLVERVGSVQPAHEASARPLDVESLLEALRQRTSA